MSYLRTFLPWIVFAAVPSGSWQWGALAALVVAVAVIGQQVRTGTGLDALIIELGSAVFFAVLAVIAFADPHSGVHGYSAALSSGTLAVIAGLSLAVGSRSRWASPSAPLRARSGASSPSSARTSSSPPCGPRPSP